MMVTSKIVAVGLLLTLLGCTNSGRHFATAATSPPVTAPEIPSTAEPEVNVPAGILAAIPFRNRGDSSKQIFQIQVVNGSSNQILVRGVQFLWTGFSTPSVPREDYVVQGQRIDFPVPFAGATCAGDGGLATMPDLSAAHVKLRLGDGTERLIPAIDTFHVARTMYLEDCERQNIESKVNIAWVDLHAASLDGRPVTEGSIQLTRRASISVIKIIRISNTVIFTFNPLGTTIDNAVVTLNSGESRASAPVRITEERCDSHAVGEASEPFNFIAQVDLGGGTIHPYLLLPPVPDRVPMRKRMEQGCQVLGKLKPLGGG